MNGLFLSVRLSLCDLVTVSFFYATGIPYFPFRCAACFSNAVSSTLSLPRTWMKETIARQKPPLERPSGSREARKPVRFRFSRLKTRSKRIQGIPVHLFPFRPSNNLIKIITYELLLHNQSCHLLSFSLFDTGLSAFLRKGFPMVCQAFICPELLCSLLLPRRQFPAGFLFAVRSQAKSQAASVKSRVTGFQGAIHGSQCRTC